MKKTLVSFRRLTAQGHTVSIELEKIHATKSHVQGQSKLIQHNRDYGYISDACAAIQGHVEGASPFGGNTQSRIYLRQYSTY